ncbi:hypothetical protein TKK_0018904 [Trichogramma kaykai]
MFTCQANSSCPSQAVLNRYSEEDIFKVSMIDRQHPVSRSMDFCILKYIIYKTDGAPVHIHVSLWRYSSCKLYMKLNHTRVTHKGQLFTMFTCQANSSCPSQAVLNRYSEEDIFKVSMIDRQQYSSCKLYMKLNHTRVTHKGQLFTMFTCQANSSCPSQAVLNRYSEEDIFKVSMIDHQHPVSRSMDFCISKYIIYRTDGAQVHIHVSLWRHSSCKFYMTLNHTRVTHKGQLFTMFPCQANSSCPSQAVLNRYSEEDIFKVSMIDHQHPVSRSMDFCFLKYIIYRTDGAQVHIHVSLWRHSSCKFYMTLNHTRVTHKGQLFTMFPCQANSSCPSQAVLNRYSEEDIFKVLMIDHQHPVSRSMDFCISKYIIHRTYGAQVHIHVSLSRQLFPMIPCQSNSSCLSKAVLNHYSEEDIFKVSMIDHQHPVSRSMDFCILKYIIYRTDGAQVHIHVSLWINSSCKLYSRDNHTSELAEPLLCDMGNSVELIDTRNNVILTHSRRKLETSTGQLIVFLPLFGLVRVGLNNTFTAPCLSITLHNVSLFSKDASYYFQKNFSAVCKKIRVHLTMAYQSALASRREPQINPSSIILTGQLEQNGLIMVLHIAQRIGNNRIFNISRTTENVYYLRCRNIQYGCHATARVYVNDPDVLIEVVPHDPSCIPSTDAIEIARFREALRTAAIRDHGEPREIYDAYALLYPEAAALLPFHAARASIRRWRLLSFPGSPNSIISMIHQLQDPANDRLFNHRTGFLTRHVMRDEDGYSHFVFYDLDVLNRVRMTVQTLLIDMTYKTCPLLPDANLQLGTVMAAYHNHSIPIIWFLLSRKTRNAYFKMSTVVRQLLVNSHIRAIVTDFELPLKTALREVFPEAYHVGCFFHFIRCLNGKLFRLGLRDYVVNNREANVFVRKCAALAFMPSDVILASFDLLLAETPARILASLQEFIDYFRSFWIRRVRPSNFSVWGVQARTNNAIESYHSVLLHRLGEHPVFWRWLCKIKQLVERQWSDFASMERGLSVARQPQNSTIFRNMVLQRAWRRYHLNDISSMELLTIGSNIIGEYFNSRFTNMRPFDVEEVMRLEERFDAALPQNDGYDPEFEHDIVGEFRPNERFRLNLRNVPAARPILMGEQNQGNGRRRRRRRRPNQGRAHQGPYQRRAAAPDDRDTAAIAVRSPRDERYHVAAVRIGHDMAVDVPRAQPPQLPDAALGEAAAIAVGIPRAPSPQYDAAAPNDDDAMAGALPRAPSPQYEAAAPNDDDAMAGALPRTQSPQLPDAALDGAAMLAVGSPISPIPWYEAAAPGEAASNFLGLPRSQSSRRLYNREELVDSDSDSDIDMTAAYHVNSTTNRASQPFHGRETAVAGPSRRFAPLPPASFASRSNRAAPSISSSTNFRLPSTQSSPPINAREATQPRRFASLPHVNFESGSSEAASAPVADRTGNVSMPSQSCRGLVPAVIEPLPNPNRNRREPENQQHHDNRDTCVVCMSEPKTHFFEPCFHYICCETCCARIMSETQLCPKCRCLATKFSRIYE